MIQFPIPDPGLVFTLIAFALFGLALGTAHFSILACNVRHLMQGRALAPAIALPLLRFAVVGGGFALATFEGAGALLSCLTGLLVARAMALRSWQVPS